MSKIADIYLDLEETLDEVFCSLDYCDFEQGEHKTIYKDNRFHIWYSKSLVAYGEILTREFSQATLLRKVTEIQDYARLKNIPYGYLEKTDECFIFRTGEKVNAVKFENDYTGFTTMAQEYSSFGAISFGEFLKWYNDLVNRYSNILPSETVERLRKVQFNEAETLITKDKICLSPEEEDAMFKALLGEFNDNTLCRFMSIEALMRTLTTGKMSMCSVLGMNDSTEGVYAESYCGYRFKFSSPEWGNNYFLSSCTKLEMIHDLTMWRLYGCDAKGVCVSFTINREKLTDFYLAPVSYAKENGQHPELDFLKEFDRHKFKEACVFLTRLPIWKHFFKPKDYSYEQEIRLLAVQPSNEKKKWIYNSDNIICPITEFDISWAKREFPLVIDHITLGSKFPHKETNVRQIAYMISELDVSRSSWGKDVVSISEISNYR